MYSSSNVFIRCLGDQFGFVNVTSISDRKLYINLLVVCNHDPEFSTVETLITQYPHTLTYITKPYLSKIKVYLAAPQF